MKIILWLGLALSACSPSRQDGQAANGGATPSTTLTLELVGAGDCVLRWNGHQISQSQLLQGSVNLLEAYIAEIDGPQAITITSEGNAPLLRVEAPAGAPWSCLAPTLGTLSRAGFPSVALRPSRVPGAADTIAQFPLALGYRPVFEPSAVLLLDSGGDMTWNGAAIGPAELRTRLAALGRERLMLGHSIPENQFVAVPHSGTRFAALLALVRAATERGVETVLSNCRAPGTIENFDDRCVPVGPPVVNNS